MDQDSSDQADGKLDAPGQRTSEFIHEIIESLSHPFYVIDAASYRVVLANAATQFRADWWQMPCYELTHGRDEACTNCAHPCPVEEVKRSVAPVTVEHVHLDAQGRERNVEIHGHPVLDDRGSVKHVIIYALDITERRNLETQLTRAQRLELLGRLAAGVAHDFNNLLSVILGYAEQALGKLAPTDVAGDDVRVVIDAGRRGASLVRSLLDLGGERGASDQTTEIDTIVRSIGEMAARLLGDNVLLEIEANAARAWVRGAASRIEQLLLNLVVNARDAMPSGGRLEITTQRVDLDAFSAHSYSGLGPGPYVALRVRDTGVGIAPEIKEHIFDPFFTTRRGSGGSGLGLSTVYSVVRESRGHIDVDSDVGAGSTFRILLPVVDVTPTPPPPHHDDLCVGRGERLLLIEDNNLLRDLFFQTLEMSGFTVDAAGSAEAALSRLDAVECGHYAALVSDVSLPGISGVELARRAQAQCPDLRVLLASGYPVESLDLADFSARGWRFVHKPVSPRELALEVRNALDGVPTSTR